MSNIEMEKVDGRERYEVRGIQAEDIIADVMLNAEASELGKAENHLHHVRTGKWIGEWNKDE